MTVAVCECFILHLGKGVFAWPPSCALSTVQSLTSALIVARHGKQWWVSPAVLLERESIFSGWSWCSVPVWVKLRCDSVRNSLPQRGYKNRIAAIISWLTGILTLTRLGSFKSYRFSNRLHSVGKCASSRWSLCVCMGAHRIVLILPLFAIRIHFTSRISHAACWRCVFVCLSLVEGAR